MTMTSPMRTVTLNHEVAAIDYMVNDRERGAVFTKKSVVDFMLDLAGYRVALPLHELRLLEPSFGGGGFLLAAADRLIASWRNHGGNDYRDLLDAIRGVELDNETYSAVMAHLQEHLATVGLTKAEAHTLANTWLVHGDYLWAEFDGPFDFIIGNPPYVRQELIDPATLNAYRKSFPTMVGRADLYVAFVERSLGLLAGRGQLSFICADAWVRNEYGRALRQKIASDFHLRHYVDMYGVEAFEAAVGAYTSIFLIERNDPSPTRVTKAQSANADHLYDIESALVGDAMRSQIAVRTIDRLPSDGTPWLLSMGSQVTLIEDLEARFPKLKEAGCRVGIGVASGADKVFIRELDGLDVEGDRKLPIALGRDVRKGLLEWSGSGVINPYNDDGSLVDLDLYPKLAAYLAPHFELLAKRHTAKENVTKRWYKTIDRITPSLTWEPKLLIPDIRGDGDSIAYDEGTVYPHHNLYYVTSTEWDLQALQAVLRSGIAHLFVEAYSTRLGGGYLRFQAQNLNRIRIPFWESVSPSDQRTLTEAGRSDQKVSPAILERIYGLSEGSFSFLEADE